MEGVPSVENYRRNQGNRMKPQIEVVQQAEETEAQIVAACRELSARADDCKWQIGRLAHEWTQRLAKGRTDEDFAKLIGLSRQQVQARREVWSTYGDVCNTYCRLSWSHFLAVQAWDDAPEWLAEANENEWSVATMKRMRDVRQRMDNGEDLTEPVEPVSESDELPYAPVFDLTMDETESDSPEHVADADPYQNPASVVKSTPRDFPVDEPPGPVNVAETKPDAIRAALESIDALIEAIKTRADSHERSVVAAKLRRLADEIEGN